MKSMDRLKKALTENGLEWKISNAVYDCGHDATGIYESLMTDEITPIIALKLGSLVQRLTGRFSTISTPQMLPLGSPLSKRGARGDLQIQRRNRDLRSDWIAKSKPHPIERF